MAKPKNTLINKDTVISGLASIADRLMKVTKSPDVLLGELFADVQERRLYSDGKTFPDLVPRHPARQIQREYALAKQDPHFSLREFVQRNFYDLSARQHEKQFVTDPSQTVSQHIDRLWGELERSNRHDQGSLMALPHPYVVPGGRFDEQYYWDSYFIMLGLAKDNRWDLIEGMVKNFAYLIRRFGFIPTANRTYFLSRSQPPFFSQMVRLLADHGGKLVYVEYLPYMIQEYNFWMKGSTKLAKQEHRAFARLVQMDRGELLNRYYDNKTVPRPESLVEDTKTAAHAIERDAERLYLHLRAGAESGWDFSSRWLVDSNDIRTIHTADIIPVDLNCLMYDLEVTIAQTYKILMQPLLSRKFQKYANRRKTAIIHYCWDKETGFFKDYNFHHKTKTDAICLAGVFPLYVKIATPKQAALVVKKLKTDFLKRGGLVTSLVDSGQQWDSPNGWAPLHWIAIIGLRNYGYDDLADTVERRWIKTNLKMYDDKHKLVEKYNVIDNNKRGSGGEYPLQDGFGWTNGVLRALIDDTVND